ncbi:MAG: fructosamine kinase family protein, partial [Solirubrobacteraceae bacterium]
MRRFVKSRPAPLPGEYATEAAGLRWLGEAGVAVPQVIEASHERLVLEWLEPGPTDPEELGRTVANLHLAGAPAFGALPPGAPGPFRIAAAEFPTGESEVWPSFYDERRLLPLAGGSR